MEGARAHPTDDELLAVFQQKYGPPGEVSWGPRGRQRCGYFLPADVYEAVVRRHVLDGCRWLDVGGGRDIFPDNPALARSLVTRSAKVVAVDPSANVHKNPFAHERIQSTLEGYATRDAFDLATMRMVVEHVDDPEAFVAALSRLVRPGGTAIVITVNRWSPLTILSRLVPFGLHYPLKRIFWGGEEDDTFPVKYRMNTREALRAHFERAGFREVDFARLDDLSPFGNLRVLCTLELFAWRIFRRLRLPYPENCLLGVYERT
jgi:SAM-dependent methyltransferase